MKRFLYFLDLLTGLILLPAFLLLPLSRLDLMQENYSGLSVLPETRPFFYLFFFFSMAVMFFFPLQIDQLKRTLDKKLLSISFLLYLLSAFFFYTGKAGSLQDQIHIFSSMAAGLLYLAAFFKLFFTGQPVLQNTARFVFFSFSLSLLFFSFSGCVSTAGEMVFVFLMDVLFLSRLFQKKRQ